MWAPAKLRRQVTELGRRRVRHLRDERAYRRTVTPRLAGLDRVTLAHLVRSRMAMLHASSFLIRREACRGARPGPGRRGRARQPERGLGPVAAGGEAGPDPARRRAADRGRVGSHVVLRAPVRHEDHIAALDDGAAPGDRRDGVGAGRVYGQLACWSAARGDRNGAMRWARQAVRSNWREPRAAIALAALSGVVRVESVLGALHKRGRGI